MDSSHVLKNIRITDSQCLDIVKGKSAHLREAELKEGDGLWGPEASAFPWLSSSLLNSQTVCRSC
jgi:hypothetical protein